MVVKKYINLLTSGRWSNKDPTDSNILALLGVDQKLAYESNKSSEKSNTPTKESTKGEPAYIKDLPSWILEEPKLVVGNKYKDGKEY